MEPFFISISDFEISIRNIWQKFATICFALILGDAGNLRNNVNENLREFLGKIKDNFRGKFTKNLTKYWEKKLQTNWEKIWVKVDGNLKKILSKLAKYCRKNLRNFLKI